MTRSDCRLRLAGSGSSHTAWASSVASSAHAGSTAWRDRMYSARLLQSTLGDTSTIYYKTLHHSVEPCAGVGPELGRQCFAFSALTGDFDGFELSPLDPCGCDCHMDVLERARQRR